IEKQERHRVTPRHQESAISFLQRVSQTAVANPAAIEEQILHFQVAALAGWIGNEAIEMGWPLKGVDAVEFLAHFGAEEEPEPIDQADVAGDFIDALAVVSERQVQARLGKSQARKDFADVPHLGAGLAEELAANGRVVEEMANLDARARGSVPGANIGN